MANIKHPIRHSLEWDKILKKLVKQSSDKSGRSVNGEIRHLLKKGLEK